MADIAMRLTVISVLMAAFAFFFANLVLNENQSMQRLRFASGAIAASSPFQPASPYQLQHMPSI